MSVVATESDW